MKHQKHCVLAFSGGLDTSFCAIWLKEQGYSVHSIIVNTGGFSPEELTEIEEKAHHLGVDSHVAVDVTELYYEQGIRYLLFGNVLKNGNYPLSVSSERIFQAEAIANYANNMGAQAIAHGSTGAGNDQIRFDLSFQILAPECEIITPIRDLGLSRAEEIAFLQSKGIEINTEKAQYSINKGLWGTSIGGKETLTSRHSLPEAAFPGKVVQSEPKTIEIQFEKGEPIACDGSKMKPTEIISILNFITEDFGIGRGIHVGDTIIGIKGRVGFEAGAAHVLLEAHKVLEKHTLSKWQMHLKNQLSESYGMFFHEGLYRDPVMRDIEAFFESSQERVSGTVFVTLYPYRFSVDGIDSEFDLMKSKVASYGEENKAWTSEDAKGFIKIYGNALNIYHNAGGKD